MITMFTILSVIGLFVVVSAGELLDGPLDLSWPYDHHTRECAGRDFEFISETVVENGSLWYTYKSFAVGEHCSTHIDAPHHFDPKGITLEKLPLSTFLVTAVFIDVAEETNGNEKYTVTLEKITEWEKANGPIPDNSVVLLRFGWSAFYYDKEKYIIKDGVYNFPGASTDFTKYLVESKKVVGVGVDGPSIDPSYHQNYPSHKILAEAGLYILENVNIQGPLPPKFKLIVAPMKIANATGGPVRLIALPLDFTF